MLLLLKWCSATMRVGRWKTMISAHEVRVVLNEQRTEGRSSLR